LTTMELFKKYGSRSESRFYQGTPDALRRLGFEDQDMVVTRETPKGLMRVYVPIVPSGKVTRSQSDG